MDFDPRSSRKLRRMLLAAWAVVIVSWLGLAVLVALSIIWPANQVPHVLLGVWLCAIVAQVVWPGKFSRTYDRLPERILVAPAALIGSMFMAGRRVGRALGL